MRKIGLFILIYNFIFMLFSDTTWYAKAYNLIDTLDIPIYILGAIVFFRFWYFKFKGLNLFYKQCYVSAFLLLAIKCLYFVLKLNYQTYCFWFYFIIAMPFILLIERNINYENIKRYFKNKR